jgi:hypothetical protein
MRRSLGSLPINTKKGVNKAQKSSQLRNWLSFNGTRYKRAGFPFVLGSTLALLCLSGCLEPCPPNMEQITNKVYDRAMNICGTEEKISTGLYESR